VDRNGLARVRHDAEDPVRREDLAHRHRDGFRRHLVDRGEPALAHLLTPARLVQLNDEIWALGEEVCRGIVEGEMTVLADTDKCYVDLVFPDQLAESLALCVRVSLTIHVMEIPQGYVLHETFAQITTE
jgi:hypothetical protein